MKLTRKIFAGIIVLALCMSICACKKPANDLESSDMSKNQPEIQDVEGKTVDVQVENTDGSKSADVKIEKNDETQAVQPENPVSEKNESDDISYCDVQEDYPYFTADEIENGSDYIFTAKYIGKGEQIIPDKDFAEKSNMYPVYTNHLFEVENVLKGNMDRTIDIRTYGGTIGNCIYVDHGRFSEGRTYFIFAKKGEDMCKNDSAYCTLFARKIFLTEEDGSICELSFSGYKPEDAAALKDMYDRLKSK